MTGDKKTADRQWVMLYEPVHFTGFSLFQFIQVVQFPEEYSSSHSMTPSITIPVQNVQYFQGRLIRIPHAFPYYQPRSQLGVLISGGGVKN